MAVTKGQIGSKHYNIETADLVDTLPNGFLGYRKHGRASTECFLYNPKDDQEIRIYKTKNKGVLICDQCYYECTYMKP